MDTIIAELRKLAMHFGPPSQSEQLQVLADVCQDAPPPCLIALYRDHNGTPECGPLALRLLSIEEATLVNHELRRVVFIRPELRLFWTDDNSHYAGIYIDGLLTGMVVLFDLDDPDYSPLFRSAGSLYQAGLAAAQSEHEWYDLETDYPVLHPATDQGVYRHELSLARTFLATYQATSHAYERRYAAYCAIKLVPFEDSHLVMPLLADQDMWIQAAACRLLGQRRYTPAIPMLAEVARNGMHNGKISSVLALGNMQHAHALQELLGLRSEIDPSRKPDLAIAIKNYGYSVKHDKATWYYRAPESDQWNIL